MSWEFSGSSVDLLRRGLTLEVSHLTNWLGTSQGLIPLYDDDDLLYAYASLS